MTMNFADVSCVSCGAGKISRVEKAYFYPSKIFCPHDKELDSEKLKTELGGILNNTSQKCGGCGTDGAPGKCKSDSKGCGGNCSCKKGGGNCSSKINLDIYDKKSF